MASLVETLIGAGVGTVVLGLVWGITTVQARQAAREEALASAVSLAHLVGDRLRADLRRIAVGPGSPRLEAGGVSFDVHEDGTRLPVAVRWDAEARVVEHRRGAEVRRFGPGRMELFVLKLEAGTVRWDLGVRAPHPRDELVTVAGELAIPALARRDAYAFWQEVPGR